MIQRHRSELTQVAAATQKKGTPRSHGSIMMLSGPQKNGQFVVIVAPYMPK